MVLRGVRQARWYMEYRAPWLDGEDVPADPLGDLRTSSNCISVWELETDLSNLELLITANAAARDKPDPFDYLIFDDSCLGDLGIGIAQTEGKTPCPEANIYHRDLTDLTGLKLVRLIRLIWSQDVEAKREGRKNVESKLSQALASGSIAADNLSASMRRNLGIE